MALLIERGFFYVLLCLNNILRSMICHAFWFKRISEYFFYIISILFAVKIQPVSTLKTFKIDNFYERCPPDYYIYKSPANRKDDSPDAASGFSVFIFRQIKKRTPGYIYSLQKFRMFIS